MTLLAENPFFIVGHPRSGTTLLRFLLSSHPRLYIPEETGFIPFLLEDRDLSAQLTLPQVGQLLERIGSLNHLWRGLVDDVPKFYSSLAEPCLAQMLDALFRQQIEEHGAARWGDKTPLYIRYIPTLDRVFPTAQFVHVIRDGRDAALSAANKWPERRLYMDNYYLLRNWVVNIERGREAQRVLGESRYLEVRYEQLVQDPRQVLERVCTFLGEEFRIDMLDHTTLARKVGPGPQGHLEVQQPIATNSVQRWKTEMTAFDRKVADRLAGQILLELGYELADLGPLSVGERLRLLLLSGKFALTSTTRRALYAMGVLTLNRGLRG